MTLDHDEAPTRGDLTAGTLSAFCPRCGVAGPVGDRFCGACGLALRVAPRPRHAAAETSEDEAPNEPATVGIPARRFTPLVERTSSTASSNGPGTDGPFEPFTVPAWIRAISPPYWAGIAVAVVVLFVGVDMYSANAEVADSCTVAGYGRFYVIEDTPTCDAATDDRDLGRYLMIAGAGAGIGLPVRALSRRKPSTDPTGSKGPDGEAR
ncbi:hypothetical protein ACR9E3_16740 [Actinomycetospora sp. C-140]